MSTINIQPVEKQVSESQHIQVHSVFYTIQGEGPFAGQPAVFVRLAGCNLQCPGCDTDYTSKRAELYPFEVLQLIDMQTCARLHVRAPLPLVVITGGEPFRQPIGPLVRMLVSKGYRVQIETNGTLYAEGLPWDSITVVCSPKTGKLNSKLEAHIDAYKYVMRAGCVDASDGLPVFALDHTAAPRVARPPEHSKKPVYLQPMDEQNAARNALNLGACIDSCMKHGYTLQVQIHKIIDME